jgi:hypothetical protein
MDGLENLSEQTLKLIEEQVQKSITSQGILTTSGLAFYYLEPAVKTLVPVYHPLLNRIPRYVPSIAGQPVGGPGVNYKALTAVDPQGYPGIPEKARAPFISFTEQDFFVPYRFFGKDGFVSFAGEQAGLGLDDNIRLTQWSLLAALLNDIEREILFGNSGTNATNGGNGFALGTTNTPVAASGSGGSLTSADYYKVWCIALTGWGERLAVGSTGLNVSNSVTTADGQVITVPQGAGALSAASNEVTGGTSVSASVTAMAGAVAYAWYISQATSTGGEATSSAYFAGITHAPKVTITAMPSGSNQKANAAGLSSDNSFSQYDTDGIITWNALSQGQAAPGYWKDLGGAGFTSGGDGSVAEIEAAMKSQFVNYQITFDEIWCAPDTIGSFTTAFLTGANSNSARLMTFMDETGNLVGGSLITEYRSRYSPAGGAKTLPVHMHPWLPNGTVLLITIKNPYPEVANAIPAVYSIPSLLDFFSLKWPFRNLSHEIGVYLFAGLQVYIPYATGLLTGVTP